LEEKIRIGGLELKALKKLYGARLAFPFSSMVLAKAIGLGAIAPTIYWCKSLICRSEGLKLRISMRYD
jgi:hypothetical protein